MSPMLDVSDEVRAEIGAAEADRLLAGDGTPGSYDCTSCRAPGDAARERTSTVLFLGQDTAILAFAHASCIPSQIVQVSEDQLREAVRSITGQSEGSRDDDGPAGPEEPEDGEAAGGTAEGRAADAGPGGDAGGPKREAGRAGTRSAGSAARSGIPEPASAPDAAPKRARSAGRTGAARPESEAEVGVPRPAGSADPLVTAVPVEPLDEDVPSEPDSSAPRATDPRPAVLGVTCGQVLVHHQLRPALVVEPTSPISRPGSQEPGDAFLPLLRAQGFQPVADVATAPSAIEGWSVLLATGRLHAILQPAPEGGRPVAWWQAHQPLSVTDGWRTAAQRTRLVLVYAAPAGSIGPQPREDLLRKALETAAARGVLVAAAMPLTGTTA